MSLLALSWSHYFFAISLMLLSIFMILVILVQRGRGGGLTGALGGMGGQSAFGTKAGDLFTRITIVVAALWVLLAMGALKILNPHGVTGYDPSLRGQATPPAKTTSGSLSPSTTKSAEAPAGKSDEGATTAPKAEAPAATAPAAPEAAPSDSKSEGKSAESAKP